MQRGEKEGVIATTQLVLEAPVSWIAVAEFDVDYHSLDSKFGYGEKQFCWNMVM